MEQRKSDAWEKNVADGLQWLDQKEVVWKIR